MGSIYTIVCRANGNFYIGSTVTNSPEVRWKQHVDDLVAGRHCNRHLQNCYSKYGVDSLSFQVIHECRDRITVFIEYMLIHQFNCPEMMNHSLSHVNPMVGRKHSAETKELIGALNTARASVSGPKISAALKGRKLSPEHIAKLTGRKLSEEHKEKLRQKLIGRKASSQTKKKMSESASKRWEDEQQRQALSEKCSGWKHTEETKRKMREAVKNKPPRKPHTEETKRKMREAARRRHAARNTH